MFFSFFNLLASFELPQPCLPLLHGKVEGCFVGKEIPNEVFVWMIGYTSPKAMCSAYRSRRDVQTTRNDLSTQRKQQSVLEGKEITRIKQDGGKCLQLLLASKSAQPEQQGSAHLFLYVYMAVMVLSLSAP